MNRNKEKKREYSRLKIAVINLDSNGNLMNYTSFEGQHNPPQHNTGPTPNPAKEFFLDDEQNDEEADL